jgi:hypothetical protein
MAGFLGMNIRPFGFWTFFLSIFENPKKLSHKNFGEKKEYMGKRT